MGHPVVPYRKYFVVYQLRALSTAMQQHNCYWLFLLAVSDSLDDILNESGDEEEQDAIVSQVLDEIGIEISGKVCLQSFSLNFI